MSDFIFGVIRNGGSGGDNERHKLAVTHFMNLLRSDARFGKLIETVLKETGFDILMEQCLNEAQSGRLGEGAERYRAALFDADIVDKVNACVADFLRGLALGFTFSASFRGVPTWAWLPAALLVALNDSIQNTMAELTGGTRMRVVIADSISVTEDDPKRYQQPDQDTVKSHVEWLYRTKIKRPPDSISAISREFGRTNKAVRDGIKTAEKLLP